MYSVLNNLQRLICHKTQQDKPGIFKVKLMQLYNSTSMDTSWKYSYSINKQF